MLYFLWLKYPYHILFILNTNRPFRSCQWMSRENTKMYKIFCLLFIEKIHFILKKPIKPIITSPTYQIDYLYAHERIK